ncbi:MAG: (Fe-S)-binding protein [Candidatus Odinarchaeota archaeon]
MASRPRNTAVFNEFICTRCGECFHRCPELQLPLEIAKQEIDSLIEGKESKYVLWHCTTCFSCNLYCPEDCKPYQLILERWNDLYKQRGAPPIYRFVCPTMKNNIWQMLYALMLPEEITLVNKWMKQEPKGNVLLICNYLHLLPFVYGNSKLLDYFTPIDPLDHWEAGAYLYQGGYLDVVKAIAEQCKEDYDRWKVEKVVPALDAVHWVLTNVHPLEMGVKHDQEIVNFHDWLLTRIEEGEFSLTEKLGMKVTVHDNCYSKAGGGKYWDTPRVILERAGCEIVEMKHIRENALCCGFGAGASWEDPRKIVFSIMATARRKFQEAEATGAGTLITYCGGCLYLLWAARELFGSKLDIYHIIEIIRKSAGETINYPAPHERRAWDLITIITYHLAMSLFQKPFWISKTSLGREGWKDHRYVGLKFLRKLFDVTPVRVIYKKVFLVMLSKMVTPKKRLS